MVIASVEYLRPLKRSFFYSKETLCLWYNELMKRLKSDDVIVVEGIHDVDKVKQVVDALILVSHGTHMSNDFLNQLEALSQTRSIVVFTDNDTPGKQIRRKISERIPNVKHAKIRNKQTKIGVEHASLEEIKDALLNTITFTDYQPNLTMNDIYTLGLNGQPYSATLREAVCYHYRLPKMNAKALLNALNHLPYSYEEIKQLCQNLSSHP